MVSYICVWRIADKTDVPLYYYYLILNIQNEKVIDRQPDFVQLCLQFWAGATGTTTTTATGTKVSGTRKDEARNDRGLGA